MEYHTGVSRRGVMKLAGKLFAGVLVAGVVAKSLPPKIEVGFIEAPKKAANIGFNQIKNLMGWEE